MCPASSAIQINHPFDSQEYVAQPLELTIIPFCITASRDIRVVVGDKRIPHLSPFIYYLRFGLEANAMVG
jgi:hypothetical protein